MINKTADNCLWQSNTCLLCSKVKYSGQFVFSLWKLAFFHHKSVLGRTFRSNTKSLSHVHPSSHHAAPMFFSHVHVFRCLESPILKLLPSSCFTFQSNGHSNWLHSVWFGLCIFSSHKNPCRAGDFTFTFTYSRPWREHVVKQTTVNDTLTLCIHWYITLLYRASHSLPKPAFL